jgi:hypothetical protein
LLKPYKQSGVLETYLKRMEAAKEAAREAAKAPVAQQQMMRPAGLDFNVMQKPMPMMPVRSDKFKTVPCKYFHGPSGCQKKEECTFIHDEYYPGVMPIPRPGGYPPMMLKPGMPIPNRNMWSGPQMLGMGLNPPPSVNINLNSLNNNSGLPSGMNGMGTPGSTAPPLNMNNLNPNNMTGYSGMPMNYSMGNVGSYNHPNPYMPPMMPHMMAPMPSVSPFLPPTVPPPPPPGSASSKK